MPEWATFAALTAVVLLSLLILSHLTNQTLQSAAPASEPVGERPAGAERDGSTLEGGDFKGMDVSSSRPLDSVSNAGRGMNSEGDVRTDTESAVEYRDTQPRSQSEPHPQPQTPPPDRDPAALSTGALLANVAISQGLFGAVLIGAAIYTGIPLWAFGIALESEYVISGVLLGTVVGMVLYGCNELGAAGIKRAGVDHSEHLRELLAPDTRGGWVVLLVVVLPIIAIFEELLFRAALIGVLAAGFGISPWVLAVISSIAFALGHGVQGTAGIIVTGTLGFVLATVFILTGSFLVVVVAHYLINALEFVVHEGLGVEWAGTEEVEYD